MNEYLEFRDAGDTVALAEWAMSEKGRAFVARAEMRQDLREMGRRSDEDIMRAVFEVKS